MEHGDETEAPRQVSVAELLARHGNPAPAGTPHRRRRAREAQAGADERAELPARQAVAQEPPDVHVEGPPEAAPPEATGEPVEVAPPEEVEDPDEVAPPCAPVDFAPPAEVGTPVEVGEPEADAQLVFGRAVLLAELLAAAAVGAALWLGFRWLWVQTPVVTVILAIAVTVATVIAVRQLRQVQDRLSALLTVVVALVVTVSPAALTLAGGR